MPLARLKYVYILSFVSGSLPRGNVEIWSFDACAASGETVSGVGLEPKQCLCHLW